MYVSYKQPPKIVVRFHQRIRGRVFSSYPERKLKDGKEPADCGQVCTKCEQISGQCNGLGLAHSEISFYKNGVSKIRWGVMGHQIKSRYSHSFHKYISFFDK